MGGHFRVSAQKPVAKRVWVGMFPIFQQSFMGMFIVGTLTLFKDCNSP